MPEIPPVYYHSSEKEEAGMQLARVFEVTGCRTQAELAKLLDLRQSSISDAKRRGCIPPHWLVKLLRLQGVNPDWVMLGTGPKFLTPSDAPDDSNAPYECFPPVRAIDALIVRKMLRCFPARDLVNELRRRKNCDDDE